MNYLKILLLGAINTEQEDSANYQIAKCLLEHIDELGNYNATQMAAMCHVSKAAVSRFCRHLGLEDFLDLQIMYRYFAKSRDEKFRFERTEKEGNLIVDFISASIQTLQDMRDSIDESIAMELVDDLSHYENIAAFGHMQSGNIALGLQHDLTDAGKYIYSSHRFGQQKKYILSAVEDTLIIIFSATGHFFEHAFQSEMPLKREHRPKIYMITVSDVPQKEYIDRLVVLCGRNNYATSILALQQYASLIALLYHESSTV